VLAKRGSCFQAGLRAAAEMYFVGIVAGLENNGQKKIAKKQRKAGNASQTTKFIEIPPVIRF
jgi:hypothetical protein